MVSDTGGGGGGGERDTITHVNHTDAYTTKNSIQKIQLYRTGILVRICELKSADQPAHPHSLISTFVIRFQGSILTHISKVSFLWDIGKHCRPRSDATERGV